MTIYGWANIGRKFRDIADNTVTLTGGWSRRDRGGNDVESESFVARGYNNKIKGITYLNIFTVGSD